MSFAIGYNVFATQSGFASLPLESWLFRLMVSLPIVRASIPSRHPAHWLSVFIIVYTLMTRLDEGMAAVLRAGFVGRFLDIR